MGEAYRALDTSLAHQVAIKVPPDGVASDVERLAKRGSGVEHPRDGAAHSDSFD